VAGPSNVWCVAARAMLRSPPVMRGPTGGALAARHRRGSRGARGGRIGGGAADGAVSWQRSHAGARVSGSSGGAARA
jgi:hypothetical protein